MIPQAAVKDEGNEIAPGVYVGVVIDLTSYRIIRCGQRTQHKNTRVIVVPGRKLRHCRDCGVRFPLDN